MDSGDRHEAQSSWLCRANVRAVEFLDMCTVQCGGGKSLYMAFPQCTVIDTCACVSLEATYEGPRIKSMPQYHDRSDHALQDLDNYHIHDSHD